MKKLTGIRAVVVMGLLCGGSAAWAVAPVTVLFDYDMTSPSGTALHNLSANSPVHANNTVSGIGAANAGGAAAAGDIFQVSDADDDSYSYFNLGTGSGAMTSLNALPAGQYLLTFRYDQNSMSPDNMRYGLRLTGNNGGFNNGAGANIWDLLNYNYMGGINADPQGDNTFTRRTWTNEHNGASGGTSLLLLTLVDTLGTPQRNVFLTNSFTNLEVLLRITPAGAGAGNSLVYIDNLFLSASVWAPEPSTALLLVTGAGIVAWRRRRS